MTVNELLSRAEDYISQYAIDLNEATFTGCSTKDEMEVREYLANKLSGMRQLLDHLEKMVDEEDNII